MSVPLRRTPSNRQRRQPLSTERWLDDWLDDAEPTSDQADEAAIIRAHQEKTP